MLLVVSARDGVQPITERVFAWARALALPTLIVISKVDAENAAPEEVLAEIKSRLKAPLAVMEIPVGEGASFQGVIAVRNRKAWLGKPESPPRRPPARCPTPRARPSRPPAASSSTTSPAPTTPSPRAT